MDATTYQREAARTLIDAPPQPLTAWEHMVVWNAVGLAGEAGELFDCDPDSTDIARLVRHACQVAELVKKGIFHEQGLDRWAVQYELVCLAYRAVRIWTLPGAVHLRTASVETLRKELGDVCWYMAALCTKLDLPLSTLFDEQTQAALSDVFAANIDKLRVRFPRGWDVADAAARVDVAAE